MTDAPTLAATAGVATVIYYGIGLLVLYAIFKHRRVPDSTLGRAAAFAATRLFVLPTLELVDWLAEYGDPRIASNILPDGLEPFEGKPA
jgi:hypothetical protein